MLEQYYSIKRNYPGHILLFRMGDFYEMFDDDAKLGSRELDIVLTTRAKHPLAGIPYHAIEQYVGRLIKKGIKVAICEQVEDPSVAKGLVKRDVVRIITPGTVLESSMLDEKSNNYIASISISCGAFGIAYADISTGEFLTTELSGEGAIHKLLSELSRLRPSELLVEPSTFDDAKLMETLKNVSGAHVTRMPEEAFELERARSVLLGAFGVTTLEPFGCENMRRATQSAGALLGYIRENGKASSFLISGLRTYNTTDFMLLDASTQRNLELVKNIRDGGREGTLLGLLDHTSTSMGGRLLKKWMLEPLLDIKKIERRLSAVDCLVKDAMLRGDICDMLKAMHDLERLMTRLAYGAANARDLVALKASLSTAARIKATLERARDRAEAFDEICSKLDPCSDLVGLIERAIVENPPVTIREGGMIKDGYSQELDGLKTSIKDAKDWITTLEARERERTGIKSLKVGFNKVFGYFIEVTKANVGLVPANYIRKQTIVNGERYITEDLQKYETIVLSAEEKIASLETELFNGLRASVSAASERVLSTANHLSQLDVLASFARAAVEYGYCRPSVVDSDVIEIKDGRHPVVERMMQNGTFVENDTHLDNGANQLILITGPNMAGKSTYMRQVALIVLMAQIGSFVPASSASIGLVDRIFTRIGAYDDLSRGQSTFMVEMIETSHILHNATPRSLVLMDEIGRGTSTFDGLAIAWSVAEFLHSPKLSSKTLFATHYHQLTELSNSLSKVRNYHMPVKEKEKEIVFLRKVVPGSADRSYGIQVAELAGLPQAVVSRAKEILDTLEKENAVVVRSDKRKFMQTVLFDTNKPIINPVIEELKSVDVNALTPLQALVLLDQLKKKAQGNAEKNEEKGKQGNT